MNEKIKKEGFVDLSVASTFIAQYTRTHTRLKDTQFQV